MMFDLVAPVFGVIDKVVDRLIPDKALAERLKAESQFALMEAQRKGELAQIDLNKVEAASSNLFVSGWRPAVGWICAGALGYEYLLAPIATWVATWAGFMVPPIPMLDGVLYELLFGLLGMGTLRTVEKMKGVAAK